MQKSGAVASGFLKKANTPCYRNKLSYSAISGILCLFRKNHSTSLLKENQDVKLKESNAVLQFLYSDHFFLYVTKIPSCSGKYQDMLQT